MQVVQDQRVLQLIQKLTYLHMELIIQNMQIKQTQRIFYQVQNLDFIEMQKKVMK